MNYKAALVLSSLTKALLLCQN